MEPLGFFGIFKVTTGIIRANMKHFLYLTAALVLPLAALSVFGPNLNPRQNMLFISTWIAANSTTGRNEQSLAPDGAQFERTSRLLVLLGALEVCVKLALVIVSTAPLTFSTCRGYLAKDLDIKSSLKSIPKVFKGLVLTSVCLYAVYTALLILVALFTVISGLILHALKINPAILLVVLIFLWVVGWVYLIIAWSLAFTVSILEEKWGWEAMRRSAYLVGGRMRVACWLFVFFGVCYSLITGISASKQVSLTSKLAVAALSMALWSLVFLYSIATTVVFYMSCKSYHTESVDTLLAARQLQEESKYRDLTSLVSPGTLDL